MYAARTAVVEALRRSRRGLRRVLYGISCREAAAATIGLGGPCPGRSSRPARPSSASSKSGTCHVVALVLDGKTLVHDGRGAGHHDDGGGRVEKVLTPFLRSLVERGLDVSQGLLVIVDGGKGLRAAVQRHRALVQRCQWHKRENTWPSVSRCGGRLQRAYNRPEYDEVWPSSRSTMSWRIGTNRRPAVWRKAWTRP